MDLELTNKTAIVTGVDRIAAQLPHVRKHLLLLAHEVRSCGT